MTARATKRVFKVWVKLGRTQVHQGFLYHRLDHDRATEWRGWRRATLTLDPPKQKKANKR